MSGALLAAALALAAGGAPMAARAAEANTAASLADAALADGNAPTDGATARGAILVTARRRAEDLQTVPLAVSVATGDEVGRAYVVNAQGLSALVPAINYSSASPRNTAVTIRGLGSGVVAVSQANDGLEPGERPGDQHDRADLARRAVSAGGRADPRPG